MFWTKKKKPDPGFRHSLQQNWIEVEKAEWKHVKGQLGAPRKVIRKINNLTRSTSHLSIHPVHLPSGETLWLPSTNEIRTYRISRFILKQIANLRLTPRQSLSVNGSKLLTIFWNIKFDLRRGNFLGPVPCACRAGNQPFDRSAKRATGAEINFRMAH